MNDEGRLHLMTFIRSKINSGEVVGVYFSDETVAPAVLAEMFRRLPNNIQAEYRALLKQNLHPESVGGDRHWDPPPGFHRMDGRANSGR
ncbi:MAG TPA: hypothetical protein DCX25_04560 [Candidatus Pacebacteria bacterium]|nr:MAG: hypothetical protein UX00_C0007G0071 [Microgenomates group bacterium GW2011_GWB1_45_17]KKU23401.1 MAG: hypothetical protein UX35_C0006G0077 [Microgenomates group bacterium GW2011_GWA1_46_15]KKU24469.1 MAG: hypothetical protein UX36_C0001G0086 [Microgenomates group bacterium GW2011_GWC1_46_15]HAV15572.1 hypothetical protein [Candidatus Paceibacterota bacterium]HCR10899.1 hypothetical protein [Candidatus Paceibacterota bacterium]